MKRSGINSANSLNLHGAREAFVIRERVSGLIGRNIGCSSRRQRITSLVASKIPLQLRVIMLGLLVVREKRRFGVSLVSGGMVRIVEEVQIVLELLLHHFNLSVIDPKHYFL